MSYPKITFEIREEGKEPRTVTLRQAVVKVGSMSSAHLPLGGEDSNVSRMHAYIRIEQDAVFISDLGSAYGTFVNGQRINKAKLETGDVIKFGDVEVTFSTESEEESDAVNEKIADDVLNTVKTKRRAFVYYCEQCFHVHGNLLELVEGETGPECPTCGGGWKLNRGQARHVVSLQLRHYMKLAMDLGMLDGIVGDDEMTLLLEQMGSR